MSDPILGSRILVVDDEPANVALLERLLAKAGFSQVVSTTKPEEGLASAREQEPDLVLLDLMMPAIDGFTFLKELRSTGERYKVVPVLVLTADPSSDTKKRALSVGANDFLTKPFDPVEVVLRTNNLLKIRHLNRELADTNEQLEHLVGLRTAEVEITRVEVLARLALVAELRDDPSRRHTRRVGQSSAILAATLGLAAHEVDTIRKAAPLHDIGKISVPESVLLKPDALTDEEFDLVETHAQSGADLLGGSDDRILETAREIALGHHENFDGSGYPAGLKGDQIPLVARIVAIADVFDALTHDRPWRPAFSVEQATNEMASQSGKQFDPQLLDAFLDLVAKQRIAI